MSINVFFDIQERHKCLNVDLVVYRLEQNTVQVGLPRRVIAETHVCTGGVTAAVQLFPL